MKKIRLFLLAVVLGLGVAGCIDEEDEKRDAADIAGTYTLVKLTEVAESGESASLTPPACSGTLVLASSGTWSSTINIPHRTLKNSGTFTFTDPLMAMTDPKMPTVSMSGVISEDGKKITITWETPEKEKGIFEYTKP